MTHPKAKPVRKPRPLQLLPLGAYAYAGPAAMLWSNSHAVAYEYLDAFQARRLAAWLIRFADWAESRKGGKR